jgi:FkbH-like protein
MTDIPRNDPGQPSSATIVVAATFVAEPLEAPLTWILGQAGLEDDIRFAPYHQLYQQLLSPGSELGRNAAGVNVLLLRIEDYVRDLTDRGLARETIARVAPELSDALQEFTGRVKGSLVLAVLRPSPGAPAELRAALNEAGASLVRRARELPGIQVLEDEHIEAVAGADRYDPVRDRLAHIPYSDTHFSALALAIARRVHAIRVPAAKVLVLDCDNTLWRGVVGEDGVGGIEISEAHAALQDFAVAQQAKGVLICLASKNTEADVLEVLERRPDMRLNLSHVVAHRINWTPKPANIRSLAAELNLGLDSFVFLDDNPVECAQMRAELPQVVTIQAPAEHEMTTFLSHLWIFDKLITTAEDAGRTKMYRENSARRAMESSVGDIGRFLAALELKIDIAAPSDDEWPRLEQLTQRTNQFNFTTRRRSARELKALLAAGAHVLRVRVSDRFGDYGLVGGMIARADPNQLSVDTLLLSCRVLGRGVEHAMLRHLGQVAHALGLGEVSLPYIATARNVPARAFADSVASEFVEPAERGTLYRLPTDRAMRIEHSPGHDPDEVIEARIADEKKGAEPAEPAEPAAAGASGRSELYSRLASVLVSGQAVREQMAGQARRPRTIGGEPAAPSSAMEAEMLRLWEELLGIDGIGVEDDYFALGGTSLLSVKLIAEIARRFGAQLQLTAILEAPTVRRLALLIDPSTDRQHSSVVCLRPGGAQNLFLVHDGLGETLLYLNLAKRLPATMSVYGIEPRRQPGIPLAHASMEDMAAFYVDQMRKIQPQGPYLLGGMCAGGVIAYEMAACLTRAGEGVQMVAILDAATPQAAKRTGVTARLRFSRLEDAVAEARDSATSPLGRWTSIALAIARKVRNFIAYELSSVGSKLSVRFRIALLKLLVRRGRAWPAALPELSFMQIYNELESRYTPPALADVPILLVRASEGDGADTPYRSLYRDEDLGWRNVAGRLELVDVNGGHSSMLQEQAIDSLASVMLARFALASEAAPSP